MIEIRPFEAADLWKIELQDSQAHLSGYLTQEVAVAIERSGTAMTAVWNGVPVAAAGLWLLDGVKYAWAYLGKAARAVMVAATRVCAAVLSRETDAVVTHVRRDIATDKRWLRLMGFATTGKVERLPDGFDYEIWVKS